MRVPLMTPVSPRYLHLNPDTNQLHVLVPIVHGQTISTDNTHQVPNALREFFEGGAVQALNAYKEALAIDIALLPEDALARQAKKAQLIQIDAYVDAIRGMRMTYRIAIENFLAKEINLYPIQLSARERHSISHVLSPAFDMNQRNDIRGNALYQAIHTLFPDVLIADFDPRARLTQDALETLPETPSFEAIQTVLRERCQALFESAIDFTVAPDGSEINQDYVDTLMGFDETATREHYIETLLNTCASSLWENRPISPFYSMTEAMPAEIRTERLSRMTQFFLATLNVHCRARGLSHKNFGQILDDSPELSEELVRVISKTLSLGDDVAAAICNFCNRYASEFHLNRELMPDDRAAIRQKFAKTYPTIAKNPDMNHFMMLDLDAEGERAKCLPHQDAICVNFAEIVASALQNQDFFKIAREDFQQHSAKILSPDELPLEEVEVAPEILFDLYHQNLDLLSDAIKNACWSEPSLQLKIFLHDSARGRQDEVEGLLKLSVEHTQTLLTTPGRFTDYSGRTFNCTAYEYAYWAKDTHLCRLLAVYMDETTKAFMLARMEIMDSEGLRYQQNDVEHCKPHFDLTPLKTALQIYLDGYRDWADNCDCSRIESAWIAIGKAQRDLPAHVVQEYCRNDRDFDPCPSFNEPTLPRGLIFYNWITNRPDSWFPIQAQTGLGFEFTLMRGNGRVSAWQAGSVPWAFERAGPDLAAVTRLDKIRTEELARLREELSCTQSQSACSVAQQLSP